MLRRIGSSAIVSLGIAGLLMTAVGVAPVGASASGVTSNTITLGLIAPLTGPLASSFPGVVSAAQARVSQQNAMGGLDGRKIHLIVKDDASSPSQNEAAASALVSAGVFGVIDESVVAFGGAKVLQQAGLPVTGGAYDGPEWFEQPYTNMFSINVFGGSAISQYNTVSKFVKTHGGTRCGAVSYTGAATGQAQANGFVQACAREGLANAFVGTIPFGSVNVTSLVLQIKAAHVDAMSLPLSASSDFALLTGLKQAGVNLKVVVNGNGYGQSLLSDTAALPYLQGAWFTNIGLPVELKTPATKAFQGALVKYAHYSGVPDFSWYEGWGGADLMIQGLELAGKNPTQTGFISALRKVTNYDMNGLKPPVNFSLKYFGQAPTHQCQYVSQLKGHAFANGQEICGDLIPNSGQLG